MNDLGNIVGSNVYPGEIVEKPVFWNSSNVKEKPKLLVSYYFGIARDINNLGNIVGYSSVKQSLTSAVFWSSNDDMNPTYFSAGEAYGINDLGNIVGNIRYDEIDSDRNVDTPVFWLSKDDPPTKLELNGGSRGKANGINNSGEIFGSIEYDGVQTPVVWSSKDDKNPTKLDLDGGLGGVAFGITNDIAAPTTTTTTTKYVPPTTTTTKYVPPTTTYVPPTTTTIAAPTTTYVPPTTTTYATTTYATTTYVPPTTTNAPPVISNICFPAGTLITTDQGPVPIERLDTTKHSIAGDPILHVVKTIVLDKYLICFPKHSIKQHMPTQETLISKEHKIFYQNKFMKASQFLDLCPAVKKVKYSGECLYNVLLANYTTMQVNNITCETLHPKNMIAKLYLKNFSEFGMNQIILQINKPLVTKNEEMYKSVTKHIS